METKLELYHLAPYLPYGVLVGQPESEGYNCFKLDIEGLRIMEVQGFENFQLMLQPLHYIIEDKNIIDMMFQIGGQMSDAIHNWIKYAESDHTNIDNAILCAPYPVVEWALEWHFDIFSLIPKGLAVPLT
jgi:hypothetical protein